MPRSALMAALVAAAVLTAACSSPAGQGSTGVRRDPTLAPTVVAEPPSPTTAATPPATATATAPPTAPPSPTAVRLPPADPAENPIEWASCGQVQCARLVVPVDHDAPEGATLELALARVPARSPTDRIGALVMNPGGPGASGVEFLGAFAETLPTELRDRFDLVSWDPRGVGGSSALSCADNPADGINEVADTLDGIRDELDEYVEETRALGDECLTRHPDLLSDVGTVATARDLDHIRAALEEDRLTYLGFSYGTRIGAVYASLFPSVVRAMVLDGAFPPGLSSTELALRAADLEAVLVRINRACDLEGSCSVADPGLITAFNQLRESLSTEPSGAPLGLSDRSTLIGATLFALYVPDAWNLYAEALHQARGAEMSGLYRLAEAWYGDGQGGFDDIFAGAHTAIMCADHAYAADLNETTADAQATLQASPLLGDLLFGNNCAGWPVEGDALPPINSTGTPSLMVVGSAFDPATPLRWAERLNVDLADSFLVTYLGDGHTAVARGNSCVDDITVTYLVDPASASGDLTCHAESGNIGVRVQPNEGGLLVEEVTPDSPASTSLVAGETITHIDGVKAEADELTTHAGQVVELDLTGTNGERTVTITAGRVPWTLPPD